MDAPPPPPIHPDYPSPPPNAIPFMNNGTPIPVYYNQTVVLQCLTSGVVSPVLIIRKVDRQATVVGGRVSASSTVPPVKSAVTRSVNCKRLRLKSSSPVKVLPSQAHQAKRAHSFPASRLMVTHLREASTCRWNAHRASCL